MDPVRHSLSAIVLAAFLLVAVGLGVRGYLPSADTQYTYNGAWYVLRNSKTDIFGVRVHDGWLTLWRIRQTTMAEAAASSTGAGDWQYDRWFAGFASSTNACVIEGKLGVPWTAFDSILPAAGTVVRLNYWLAMSPLAGIAVLYFMKRFRPKSKHGDCRACGYDLTGNVTGQCPECGNSIAARDSTSANACVNGAAPPGFD